MNYFDRVYCIHMPDPKRREAIEEQFKKVGIVGVQYVYAARPRSVGNEPFNRPFHITNMRRAPATEFAVNLSHIKAVAHAIADGAKRPLFVEDDIVFRDDANEILTKALEALPENWDVLYMGGHPCEKVKKLSDNLVKIARFSFAEAYALNGLHVLECFHDYWLDNIGQPQAMYDFILSRFAQDNGYCVYPVLTHQPIGYSHISKVSDDKSDLVRRGWENNLI